MLRKKFSSLISLCINYNRNKREQLHFHKNIHKHTMPKKNDNCELFRKVVLYKVRDLNSSNITQLFLANILLMQRDAIN